MLILPPETERLAQRLAAAQGTTPATAVQRALEQSAREAGVSEGIPRRSASLIAPPTRSPGASARRCSSRARISRART
ncbi:hypothetical protein [Roseomonas sp. AR75]|uniref:hypothetical protein n=1 Tax=Roseomonas sp. AR75 TaxID=2562311 RepID=UPI0010BFEE5F|nr:hypothetical protein [Roseomonas sp. AR75]